MSNPQWQNPAVNKRAHINVRPADLSTFGNAVEVAGPYGPVRLIKTGNWIIACYVGNQLVNGSAVEYTLKLREAALRLVDSFPFPWQIRADSSIQVLDQEQYYEQTFSTQIAGIEKLRSWLDGHPSL